jgi:two-component system phosphate regulon sensor histidine kinase PhoR
MDFTVTVDEGLPRVEVDQEAVAGALLNLLQNAFKYTGADKRIRLRARQDGPGVAIDVGDNGSGIAPRDKKRIFERFYRADTLLTRHTEGTGLGLSIAQRIAVAHHGKITVESQLGQGSTFSLHLPAARNT